MKRFQKYFEAGFTMFIGVLLCFIAFLDAYDYAKIEPSVVAAVAGLGIMWAGASTFKLIRTVENLESKKRK